jgi:hypothetical protein
MCASRLQIGAFLKSKFPTTRPSYYHVYHPLESPTALATQIDIVHFNDVYNVDFRDVEPVGGAPKFVSEVKQLAKVRLLLCLNAMC